MRSAAGRLRPGLLSAAGRAVVARVIERVNPIVPKGRHVVVYGFPPTEGNAVEVLRELTRRYRGRVFWFDAPVGAQSIAPGARTVRRLSLAGLVTYLTAEVVFYTHGLYGDPAPARTQAIVNLWHGDGIKANNTFAGGPRSFAPATYVVGSTRVLTAQKARDFRTPVDAALVTGNPRTDQFFRLRGDGGLRGLGVPDARPFVVWLPTFRRSRAIGAVSGWDDIAAGSEHRLEASFGDGVRHLIESGITVVVKPHPRDADSLRVAGAVLLTDADLNAAGVGLYELLGRSSGLISDYSSVWVDYLLLDRPIGFLIPDKLEYAGSRGLYPPDVLEWLPGPELDRPEAFAAFAEEVLGRSADSVPARRAAVDRLGLTTTHHAAADLLVELERRGAFRRTVSLRPQPEERRVDATP